MPEVTHKEVTHKKARAHQSDQSDIERVNKQWQTTTDRLAEARTHLAHWELAVAEKTADGEDATEALRELQRAESAVKQFESAVAVLWQRKEDAAVALQEEENQVKIEIEAAAAKAVIALGPRGEGIFESVRQYALDMARATEALRVAGGNEKYAYPMTQTRAQFEFFLSLASHPRTADFPSALKMYESFTDCLVATCGIGIRTQP